MSKVEQIRNQVINLLEKNESVFRRLKTPPLTLDEILAGMQSVITTVEYFDDGETLTGPEKNAVVKGVFDWLDRQFGFKADFIKALFEKVKWLKWIPKSWKNKIADAVIDMLVKLMVKLFNNLLWKIPEPIEAPEPLPGRPADTSGGKP